jgi:hypothetical protein
MSRIVQFTMAAAVFVGIAGCGNGDKPADPSQVPKVDQDEIKKNMEKQMKSRTPDAPQFQPAGDGK